MKPTDKRRNNEGGYKVGRPTEATKVRTRALIGNAMKEIYGTDSDDESKIAFIKDLHTTERGKLFLAEHLFGKAPQVIEAEVTVQSFELAEMISFEGDDDIIEIEGETLPDNQLPSSMYD